MLGVDPDWILCGNGSDEILTLATRASSRRETCCACHIRVTSCTRRWPKFRAPQRGSILRADWSLPDTFAAQAEGLRLAFLPNPNSPSGTLLSPARVLELAERLPCPLLVDEAYVDFADTNCLNLVAQNEKVLVSRTLSKSYALAGLRFGYLVASRKSLPACAR